MATTLTRLAGRAISRNGKPRLDEVPEYLALANAHARITITPVQDEDNGPVVWACTGDLTQDYETLDKAMRAALTELAEYRNGSPV